MATKNYRTTGLERPDLKMKRPSRARTMPPQHCKHCGRPCGHNWHAGTQYCSTSCTNDALRLKAKP